jgi:hypothetical protein
MMTQLRSVRVQTAPIEVRIVRGLGWLINISATGVLVQAQRALTERDWSLIIHASSDPVKLHARVVRSTPVSVQLPEATWRHQEFAVALTFTDLPPKAQDVVKQLCGQAFDQHE